LTKATTGDRDSIFFHLGFFDNGIGIFAALVFIVASHRDGTRRTAFSTSLTGPIEVIKTVGIRMREPFL
jgi:hypothetical protein